MSAALRALDLIERTIIALCSALALAIACLGMSSRYIVPGMKIDWTFELIIFLVIWASFIAAARMAGTGEHVRVDTLTNMLPAPAKAALAILAVIMGLGVAAFLLWSGTIVVEEAFRWDERTTSSLRLPLWLYYLCLPVCAALTILHLIVRLYLVVTGRASDDLAPAHDR
jgi:C4-dicarboxylate transporter DctQ subunit